MHDGRQAVEMRPHRRRVQESAKRLAGLIWRQPWRDEREERQRGEKNPGAANHACSPDLTRGSV